MCLFHRSKIIYRNKMSCLFEERIKGKNNEIRLFIDMSEKNENFCERKR